MSSASDPPKTPERSITTKRPRTPDAPKFGAFEDDFEPYSDNKSYGFKRNHTSSAALDLASKRKLPQANITQTIRQSRNPSSDSKSISAAKLPLAAPPTPATSPLPKERQYLPETLSVTKTNPSDFEYVFRGRRIKQRTDRMSTERHLVGASYMSDEYDKYEDTEMDDIKPRRLFAKEDQAKGEDSLRNRDDVGGGL